MSLRAWMKKEGFFDVDLERILEEMSIEEPEDFGEFTEPQWDEFVRQAKVTRAAEITDAASHLAMEQKLSKIERHWRAMSGIKKGGGHDLDDEKERGDRLDERSVAERDEALITGKALKDWMKIEGFLDIDLVVILVKSGVTCKEQLAKIESQAEWDEIERQARVQRAADSGERIPMARLEKTLSKLETVWRKLTGIKKGGGSGASGVTRSPRAECVGERDEVLAQGKALKAWMKKEGILDIDLLLILVKSGVRSEEELVNIESQAAWDEIERQARVQRAADSGERIPMARLEKTLSKLETFWRKKTGIKKGRGAGTKKKKTPKPSEEKKDDSSVSLRDECMAKGRDLKMFMKKKGCLNIDLFMNLVRAGVVSEETIVAIDTQSKWNEIVRKTKVDRATTSAMELSKLEKTVVKFEKIWRAKTGIKKGAVPGGKRKKKKKAASAE